MSANAESTARATETNREQVLDYGTPAPSRRTEPIKLAVLVLLFLALAAGLLFHLDGLNGPYYWRWPWRHLATLRVFAAMLVASLPLFAGIAIIQHLGDRARPAIVFPLLMLAMLAMQLAAAGVQHEPFAVRDGLARVVISPSNTSYYYDAVRASEIPLSQFLHDYPQLMPQFTMHAQEKPPGPMLFFAAVAKVFGVADDAAVYRTAAIAGLLIGILATLNVPVVYALARMLGADRGAALLAAAMMCLMPGLVLHLPMLDQLYPIITCVLLIAWVRALENASVAWAAIFGVALAGATFVVYHFLVLGAFLLLYSVWFVRREPRRNALLLGRLSLVALVAWAMIYVLLFATTGYDVLATFRTAMRMQGEHLAHLYRPYPWTILHDLQDFALGFGWLAGAMILCLLFDRGETTATRRDRIVALLCLAQPVIVAATGLMQTETARTWCFMLPLITIPAAIELSRWRSLARWAVILMIWLILCLVLQNLAFIFHPGTGESMFAL
jgi:hypothetical protein